MYFVIPKEPFNPTCFFNAEPLGMGGRGWLPGELALGLKLELSAPTSASGERSSQSLVVNDLISLACAMKPPFKKTN